MAKTHLETIAMDIADMEAVEGAVPETLPILAVQDAVLFPTITMPVQVQREASKKLLKLAKRKRMLIGVVAQCTDAEFPQRQDLEKMGCLATVVTVGGTGDDCLAILNGGTKFLLGDIIHTEPYLEAKVSPAEDKPDERPQRSVLTAIKKKFLDIADDNRDHFTPPSSLLRALKSDELVVNMIAANAPLSETQKQTLLEIASLSERADELLTYLTMAQEAYLLEKSVDAKVHKMMDKQQREYFLNQQLHVIQDELGGSPYDKDMQEMELKARNKKWNSAAAAHFSREMQRLRRIPPQQPDFFVQQNYLEFMLSLPWDVVSKDNLDMKHARRILDRDHYGLEKIKQRILEYIAALRLKHDLKAPILCLVGPPGTGKTSLGRSIADVLDRQYVRMALGGVHDESEIRGHRRTYVGAMAGRVLQSIKRAGVSNPVIVLDEVDKVQSNSFNGDPTSALLEVLDPEQNVAFHDNYLDINYDLSRVLFIATANNISNVQPALLDRMEVIDISGYLQEEKLQIAKRYLVPRLLKEYGITDNDAHFQDGAIRRIIDEYTRESGVRQLEQQLAACVRKRCVTVAELESEPKPPDDEPKPREKIDAIKPGELNTLLGLPLNTMEKCTGEDLPGVVTGLAWTQNGGVILYVEASLSKGEGKLTMTGNLGTVMKESATLAYEYLKANAKELGIKDETLETNDIHIHCPEGATPKDGPSAGITMFTAMVSVFTGSKVRCRVAMTGEITLRGAVTPIGGVREKILAAKRAGCTDLVLCQDNRRDVEDIPSRYLDGLAFHYIKDMKEVLPLALVSRSAAKQ